MIVGQADQDEDGLVGANIIPPVFTQKTFQDGECARTLIDSVVCGRLDDLVPITTIHIRFH